MVTSPIIEVFWDFPKSFISIFFFICHCTIRFVDCDLLLRTNSIYWHKPSEDGKKLQVDSILNCETLLLLLYRNIVVWGRGREWVKKILRNWVWMWETMRMKGKKSMSKTNYIWNYVGWTLNKWEFEKNLEWGHMDTKAKVWRHITINNKFSLLDDFMIKWLVSVLFIRNWCFISWFFLCYFVNNN